jgi:uncharacterized protein YbjT (DUF2867 family)
MKVVITGATGNVGTSTVQALSESQEIDEIVGLARRQPTAHELPLVEAPSAYEMFSQKRAAGREGGKKSGKSS